MDRLDLVGTARASFYVYNDEEDVARLVSGLHRTRAIFAA
jgi:selenocysteine lyase/cysteine desulfurase